jgi:GDP-L-fucose synthase
MPEEELLQGPAEPTNMAYAAAKLSGFVQCQSYFKQFGRNYFTVVPASFYGPHDNYDLNQCHVTPALLLRFHMAKKKKDPTFSVWGTGQPRRELLYVADAARGVRMLLEGWHASKGPVNLGAGDDLSVADIARTIKRVVGFDGELVFDTSKPDGNPRKLLDSARINSLGFKPEVDLETGLKKTYDWLLSGAQVRGVKAGDL